MLSTLLTTATTLLLLLPLSTLSQTIPVLPVAPAGYETGFATQDYESVGQKSICNTNCPGKVAGGTTSGPSGGLAPGIYAAAINPAMGGGAADCAPCGSCYSIVNSGTPLCAWDAKSCPLPGKTGPTEQTGPSNITVLITNHCTDCTGVDGWFDINEAPNGWNNAKTYWKQLPDEACF